MLDGLYDKKYRIERLESCMLGNGHVQFGGGPMEKGRKMHLASGLPNTVYSRVPNSSGGSDCRRTLREKQC
jgi:hypothetical protein